MNCNALSPPTFGSYGWRQASTVFSNEKWTASPPENLATWRAGDHDNRNGLNSAVVALPAFSYPTFFSGVLTNEFRSARQRAWWMKVSRVVACIYLFPKDVFCWADIVLRTTEGRQLLFADVLSTLRQQAWAQDLKVSFREFTGGKIPDPSFAWDFLEES